MYLGAIAEGGGSRWHGYAVHESTAAGGGLPACQDAQRGRLACRTVAEQVAALRCRANGKRVQSCCCQPKTAQELHADPCLHMGCKAWRLLPTRHCLRQAGHQSASRASLHVFKRCWRHSPAPLGPRKPKRSPLWMPRHRPSRAGCIQQGNKTSSGFSRNIGPESARLQNRSTRLIVGIWGALPSCSCQARSLTLKRYPSQRCCAADAWVPVQQNSSIGLKEPKSQKVAPGYRRARSAWSGSRGTPCHAEPSRSTPSCALPPPLRPPETHIPRSQGFEGCTCAFLNHAASVRSNICSISCTLSLSRLSNVIGFWRICLNKRPCWSVQTIPEPAAAVAADVATPCHGCGRSSGPPFPHHLVAQTRPAPSAFCLPQPCACIQSRTVAAAASSWTCRHC